MTKLNIRIGSLLQWQGITQCRGELGIVIGLLNGNGYDGILGYSPKKRTSLD